MSTALELTLLTALSALAFAMAVVFGYGVAGVVFAALLSTTGVSILGVVLDWFQPLPAATSRLHQLQVLISFIVVSMSCCPMPDRGALDLPSELLLTLVLPLCAALWTLGRASPLPAELSACIISDDGQCQQCRVVHLSPEGAKLTLSQKDQLPANFTVSINGVERRSQLIWQTGLHAGVEFVEEHFQEPGPLVPS